MIEANVRVPEVIGDIRAQYVANVSAARRLQDLGRQYGPTSLPRRWPVDRTQRGGDARGNRNVAAGYLPV